MFTGLVESLATVTQLLDTGDGRRLVLHEPTLAPQLVLGESVSVNGTCLTVVHHDAAHFSFDVGPETLLRTNLGALNVGERVNLERALLASSRLGGHLVQGHVDGVGTIREKRPQGDWVFMAFSAPPDLLLHMVPKGSICVDGISLTLVEVTTDLFSVMLIPHTLAHTTLGFKERGAAVNLETDLLAKYVFKALDSYRGRLP